VGFKLRIFDAKRRLVITLPFISFKGAPPPPCRLLKNQPMASSSSFADDDDEAVIYILQDHTDVLNI
jgi:hypothetical protein